MAWDFIAISGYVETSSSGGDITLTEPTGAQQGDLLVACIAYRSNAAFTLPTGGEWALVATQQSSGDEDATQGIASGLMAYCVRGGSAPNYVFTRTDGNVAQGTVLCYRGNLRSSSVYDTGAATTLGTIGEPALSGISTAEANELIIGMISHGDNSLCATFDAVTNPATASGDTDTTTEPTANTWIERFDRGSNTGADTGLMVVDGLKSDSGATGNFSADAVTTTRSVIIVGAFKMATNITLSVAECSHAHSVDATVLTQVHSLTVAEAVHAHSVDSPVLTQVHTLVTQECSHPHSVDSPTLIQNHNLSVADSTHSHTADGDLILVEEEGGYTLVVSECSHSHSTDSIAVTQAHVLVCSESSHSHSVDPVALTQVHNLTVSESSHLHSTDAIALIEDILLSPNDALHSHIADAILLTQSHLLQVGEISHSHVADNIDVTQVHYLLVSDSTHPQSADSVDLVLPIVLVVSDGSHTNIADAIALTQVHTLSVQDGYHGDVPSADIILLTTGKLAKRVTDTFYLRL